MKIVIANLFSFGSPAAAAVNRRDDLIRALHDLAGDIYAVAEVWGTSREEAVGRLYHLAAGGNFPADGMALPRMGHTLSLCPPRPKPAATPSPGS